MIVPFNDLNRIHKPIMDDSLKVFKKIIDNNQFVLNEYIKNFETEFATFTNQKNCISCSNGTDAIELILRGLDIGPGDEVLLPTNSFIATSEAVSRAGATPVFIDNDEYYLINCSGIEKYLTKKTKAIIAVNLYGQMCNLKELSSISKKNGVHLIEDAAQSHGAKDSNGKPVGYYSTAAAYSFYPGKNLGAWGDGGGVTTNSNELAKKMKALRDHGSEKKYYHKYKGFNSRLQPFQGYVLSRKLSSLEEWNEERNNIAFQYNDAFSLNTQIITPQIYNNNRHVWHLYVLRVKSRKRFMSQASEQGVETSIHYPVPIHRQKAYSDHKQSKVNFENADSFSKNLVSLPIFPKMKKSEINKVIDVVSKITQ